MTRLAIPQIDLAAGYRELRQEIDAAVARVLGAGAYVLGPETTAFEVEFAAYCGVSHAVGVASGTDALHLALRALGVGPGDEVITVSLTAVGTVAAIELAGARPVLVDVEALTGTIDPDLVERAVTARTRAIVPVHLYGQPADLAPILEAARRRSPPIAVVEDCAQAHGARYAGRPVGGWGEAAAFSFYPTKNLGAAGDGGAVLTPDPQLADRIRLLRQYGWRERQVSEVAGYNSRLDELQAAILRAKLPRLDEWNDRRRKLAARYAELLAGTPLGLPVERGKGRHVYHLYVVQSPRRDALRAHLAARGIGSGVHYPVPVHLQPGYTRLGYPAGSMPVSERLAQEVLSLPLHPQLSEDSLRAVTDAVLESWSS